MTLYSENSREVLSRMLLIREFEDSLRSMFSKGQIPGFVHLYTGQEAVATGVCSVLETSDTITSTHRGHGHILAKGADPYRVFAELLGREDGYCRGKAGSMHVMARDLGILGANGIVGGGIPLAAGSAWSSKVAGDTRVSIAFFGDGASNQGVFFEVMNLAALWKLPLVLVCENNGYSEWTATEELTAGEIWQRAQPFGIPSARVDGNDVDEVMRVAGEAVSRARAGDGPSLIEAMTYRWYGHNQGEEAFSGEYRPQHEIEAWLARDPVESYRSRLIANGRISDVESDALVEEIRRQLEDALERANSAPFPSEMEALQHVYY